MSRSARAEQRDDFSLRRLQGIDERGDDAHESARAFARLRSGRIWRLCRSAEIDGVTGLVVGVPGLGLEFEEDRRPYFPVREFEHQPAVLPWPVVAREPSDWVSPIHMDIVNAAARPEAEIIVRFGLRAPRLTECVDHRAFVCERALDELVELLVEVIIGSRLRIAGAGSSLRAASDCRE